VIHAQPLFTKNMLNMLSFLAKYDGVVLGGYDCVLGLYVDDLADGSRREKREPMTRVAG
jgi:hypothetical protein